MERPDTPAVRAVEGSRLRYEVVETEPARTVEESAAFQGIDPTRLLKSLVVRRGPDDYVFVLVPGRGLSTGLSCATYWGCHGSPLPRRTRLALQRVMPEARSRP